jgi:hypothetical protein
MNSDQTVLMFGGVIPQNVDQTGVSDVGRITRSGKNYRGPMGRIGREFGPAPIWDYGQSWIDNAIGSKSTIWRNLRSIPGLA